jgi:hypothetical protein
MKKGIGSLVLFLCVVECTVSSHSLETFIKRYKEGKNPLFRYRGIWPCFCWKLMNFYNSAKIIILNDYRDKSKLSEDTALDYLGNNNKNT